MKAKCILARKLREQMQRIDGLERLRVKLKRSVRSEDAGAAARRLLVAASVWRAICSEVELRRTGGDGVKQRLSMLLSLCNRLAEVMGPQRTAKKVVSVDEAVVRSDRSSDV